MARPAQTLPRKFGGLYPPPPTHRRRCQATFASAVKQTTVMTRPPQSATKTKLEPANGYGVVDARVTGAKGNRGALMEAGREETPSWWLEAYVLRRRITSRQARAQRGVFPTTGPHLQFKPSTLGSLGELGGCGFACSFTPAPVQTLLRTVQIKLWTMSTKIICSKFSSDRNPHVPRRGILRGAGRRRWGHESSRRAAVDGP